MEIPKTLTGYTGAIARVKIPTTDIGLPKQLIPDEFSEKVWGGQALAEIVNLGTSTVFGGMDISKSFMNFVTGTGFFVLRFLPQASPRIKEELELISSNLLFKGISQAQLGFGKGEFGTLGRAFGEGKPVGQILKENIVRSPKSLLNGLKGGFSAPNPFAGSKSAPIELINEVDVQPDPLAQGAGQAGFGGVVPPSNLEETVVPNVRQFNSGQRPVRQYGSDDTDRIIIGGQGGGAGSNIPRRSAGSQLEIVSGGR